MEKYGNFVFKKRVEIPEILCTLIELEHEPTGAQIMQVVTEDDENLFNLSFRTWPDKSNGVAHILEHTVLCGSKKYPVRDPFFSMNRRSLNTFMNALTGGDFTCYPAASLVSQDFYNLLEVYLDAVFHPLLTEISFRQEGHRLEFLKADDPSSPLTFKGIVFNEMKGALATGDARLNEELMATLFPHLTYGVNSGGDPKEILTLTYPELKAFHRRFYHPSRCLFFFYGNLPLEAHLDFLEEHAFKGVKKAKPLPLLPQQARFRQPVHKKVFYPISEEEDPSEKTLIGMAWLTCSILDQVDSLALTVLEVVLMGTDAAPLKKALLKSNLCKQAESVMDTELSELPFCLFFKGCQEARSEALEHLVRTVLESLVEEGLPEHLIDGAIHQIEMSRTEITGYSSPYGLSIYFRSALLKQHGGNAEDGLRVHSLFNQLRKSAENPTYFPTLIKKYFLHNPHFVRIEMHPDKTLSKKELEEEKGILEVLAAGLKEKEIKKIIRQAQELAAFQEEQEDDNSDLLPKVTLRDVAREGKEFGLKIETLGPLKVYTHPCFTNELLYVDLVFDLPEIEEEDLPYLRLFSLLLPQMGCGNRTYSEHLDFLLQHTGGIGASLDLFLQPTEQHLMRPSLTIRGKSLYRKRNYLFPIIRDVLTSVDFTDVGRIRELLLQHYSGIEHSIQHSSLRYAVNLAARGFSISSKILNSWYGLDYFWKLKEILTQFESDPAFLIDKLRYLQTQTLGLEGGELILACDDWLYEDLKQSAFYGLLDIPHRPFSPWKNTYSIPETPSQGRIISSPVAFTALLFPSISYSHPDAPALSLAAEIMENLVLHMRIREQGGAYGSGTSNNLLAGQFYFYSFRDPHLSQTLAAFHEAVESLAKGEFTKQNLEEAKLELFQDLDAPVPPGSRAYTAYTRLRGGRTPEMRQAFREKLFSLQKKDIQQAVEHHLKSGIKKGKVVSFAGKELLEKENKLLDNPLALYSL